MPHLATNSSSQWSWCPDIIFRQLNDNTTGDDVIAGTVVCKEKHSQADRKEKCQRKVLDRRSHHSTVGIPQKRQYVVLHFSVILYIALSMFVFTSSFLSLQKQVKTMM